jgi:ribonuclease-3
LQKSGPRIIVYQLISQSGPPHDRTFTVEVWVDGEALGSGSGKSKKEAEQLAAQTALATLG